MQRVNRRLAGWLTTLAAVLTVAMASPAFGANVIWTGGGGNANWNNAGNWSGGMPDGNTPVFTNNGSFTTLTNDYPGAASNIVGIIYTNNAFSYTLKGNAITLGGSIVNNSTAAQTNSMDMTISATRIVTGVGGAVTVLSGNISGNGGLTLQRLVSGTHTVTLSGSNSYSGVTTWGNGSGTVILNINHNNALGSGSLTTANANTFDNTSGTSVTITNNVTINGNSPTFTGTTNLTINGIYTNGNASQTLTVSGSTLTLKSIDASATGNTFTKSGPGTLAITGAAGANLQGQFTLTTGTLILGNKSAAGSGTFSLNGGTLQASADLSGANAMTNNALLSANSTVSGTNSITFAGAYFSFGTGRTLTNSLAAGKTLTFSGSVTNSGTTAQTLTIAGTGATTFSGGISNGTSSAVSLTINNTGVTTLSGTNTYTGTTTVNGGLLKVNGQTGTDSGTGMNTVTVNAGGALGGNGRVGGAITIANSATAMLYPNNAFAGGTLTCGDNVTFAGANAIAKFDLSASASSGNDKVVLESKTLTCGGASIMINATGMLDTATDYTLFDVGSGGTISGNFAATPLWTGTAPANSNQYTVTKDTRYVYLHYTAPATPPTVVNDSAVTTVGTPVTINVTTNDTNFTAPIYQVLSNLLWSGSSVQIQNTNLLYTPAVGSNGVDQFQYVVTNASGSATGTVTVTVNIPPLTAGNDGASTLAGSPITIHVTTNDTNFVAPIGSVLSNLLWAGSAVSIANSTNLVYTPAPGSNGVDQFQYVITNAFSQSATATVSVTVSPPAVPTVGNDSAVTFVATPVAISVTTNDANFIPPIGEVLSNLLWGGSSVQIQNTNLLYTPAAGSNGVDQFQYVVTNASGSATGTVTVTVNIPPPSASNDTAATIVNGSITIPVTTNDANFAAPIASVTPLTWPGSAVSVTNGTNVYYSPAVNSNGTDSFRYVITNAFGQSATGTVSVTVSVPTSHTWDGGGGDDKWSTGANWDYDAAPVFPLALAFDGSTRLTPSNDYTGVTNNSLTFDANAGAFTLGGNAVTLGGPITNLSPATQTIAMDMTLAAVRTVAGTGSSVTVLSGNLSGNGGITLSRLGSAGTATLTLSGNNSYTNATTVPANAVLNINHNNALGSGTLTISGAGTIDNTSGSPVTITNNVSHGGGTLTFGGTTNLTINGTYTITASRTLNVNNGTLTLKNIDAGAGTYVFSKGGGGTLAITDAAGATFQGGFTLSAGTLILGHKNAIGSGLLQISAGNTLQASTDLSGANAIGNDVKANGSFTVSGANSVTVTGAFTVVQNKTLTSSLAAGKTLTISGNVTNSAAPASTFTLAGTGDTTFSGAISDGASSGMSLAISGSGTTTLSGTNTYSGTTTITNGILKVIGQTGTDSGTGSGAVSVNAGGTLGGNGRVAGAITIANTNTALLYPNNAFAGGTLTCGSNVTFAGSNAVAKFDLTASASSGNDKVVLENKTLTCGGATVVINSAGTLAAADYTLFDVEASGTISGNFAATPLWTGAAPANSNQYTVTKDTRYVYLHYLSPPTAGDDSAVTFVATPVTISVTTNDTYFNPPIYRVLSNLLWIGSSVQIQNTNLFYTPAPGSNGVDQFQYVVTNVLGQSATGTVTVTVNVAPLMAGNDSAVTIVGQAITVNATANDFNFTPPLYQVLSNLLWAGSTVTITDGTNLYYTPAAGSNGVDQFQYVITNASEAATGTVTVTVNIPSLVASNDTATTIVNGAITINVTTNDANYVVPIANVTPLTWPGSSVSITGGTNVYYTPAANSNGTDSFRYVITNAYGQSATGTVTVTVTMPTSRTWDGGGADDKWSTGANWDYDAAPAFPVAVTFDGSTRLTPSNDSSSVTVNGITFGATAGAFTIGGNAIALNGNIGSTAPTDAAGARTQTINVNMDIGASTRTITAAGNSTHYHNITLAGVISGAGGLTKATVSGANNAVVTLTGVNTFEGKMTTAGSPLSINSIANSNTACAIGKGSLINLSGTLMYTGVAAGTDRQIEVAGNSVIRNDGGALTFANTTFNVPVGSNTCTLTLGGAGPGTNEIQGVIQNQGSPGLISVTLGSSSVPGNTWRLSGTNTCSGTVTLSYGGILEAATLGYGGVNSSLGASGNVASNLVFGPSGGTLRYVGATDVTTDRAFTYPNSGAAVVESCGAGTLTFDTPANAPAFPATNVNAILTLGGSNTGTNTFGKTLVNNPADSAKKLTLRKTGAGRWILAGGTGNTHSGNTTVSGGALEAGLNAASLSTNSYLELDGGVLQASGSFTRTNGTAANGGNFQWSSANGGGFSAQGGKLTVTVGNSTATEQNWGASAANNAIVGALMFGSVSANGEVEFQNGINLLAAAGTTNRVIDVAAGAGGDFATLSGVIRNSAGTAGIVKTGAGTLKVTAANTYNGGTTISGGTLGVNNGSGSGTGGGAVSVDSGTLGGTGRVAGAITVADTNTAVLYPHGNFAGATLACGSNVTFAGSHAVAKFDLSASAGAGNDKVVLENKTLTIVGTPRVVINSAGVLDAADYVLFDVGAGGSISGRFDLSPVWAGTPPAVNAWVVQVKGTTVVLHAPAGTVFTFR